MWNRWISTGIQTRKNIFWRYCVHWFLCWSSSIYITYHRTYRYDTMVSRNWFPISNCLFTTHHQLRSCFLRKKNGKKKETQSPLSKLKDRHTVKKRSKTTPESWIVKEGYQNACRILRHYWYYQQLTNWTYNYEAYRFSQHFLMIQYQFFSNWC